MHIKFKNNLSADRHVLIIGGAGYIGSFLVRKLLSNQYKVKVLDNLIHNNGSSIAGLFENHNFTFLRGDYSDKAILLKSLADVTDVVLLAAIVGDPACKKYPEVARKTNQEAAIQLFDSLSGRGINRFIFASTCSNYGLRENDEPATEESELNPKSIYAETKVNFERYILENKNKVDFSPTILRVSTAYGISYRMRFDLTISEFTRELVLGRKLLVYDENTWRPYCHVNDISVAIIKVIECAKEKVIGQIFNVGSNSENFTKKMIVETILRFLPDRIVNYQQGGYDPRNYRVSFDKIFSVLNFKNEFEVPKSIGNLINAIQNGAFDDVEARGEFYRNY